ncbi:hypothetical protein ACWDR0_05490 [Streptomyces sp. NPDC003691]
MNMPGFTAAPYRADGFRIALTDCGRECHHECWSQCEHKYNPTACMNKCMGPCVSECEYTPECWDRLYCDADGCTMSERRCRQFDGSITVDPPIRISATCDI